MDFLREWQTGRLVVIVVVVSCCARGPRHAHTASPCVYQEAVNQEVWLDSFDFFSPHPLKERERKKWRNSERCRSSDTVTMVTRCRRSSTKPRDFYQPLDRLFLFVCLVILIFLLFLLPTFELQTGGLKTLFPRFFCWKESENASKRGKKRQTYPIPPPPHTHMDSFAYLMLFIKWI